MRLYGARSNFEEFETLESFQLNPRLLEATSGLTLTFSFLAQPTDQTFLITKIFC